jgi:quercetin dioxygenase-like cupin family protein
VSAMKILEERDFAHVGKGSCDFRKDQIAQSAKFRTAYDELKNIVLAEDMPFEQSPDGLLKHLMHERLLTKECCIEAYMQFIPGGERSGKHRHMWEEVVFVAEGRGYDLHWDLKFECLDAFAWDWEEEPKTCEWSRGDFIYIPPFSIHQHFNLDPKEEARLVVISNRIVRAMGFDWLDQIENAPGF